MFASSSAGAATGSTFTSLVARRSPATGAPSARCLLATTTSQARLTARPTTPATCRTRLQIVASRPVFQASLLSRSFASTSPSPPLGGGGLPPNPPRPAATTVQPISPTDPAALPELSASSPLKSVVPPKRRSLFKRLLKATLWLNFGGFMLVVLGGGSLWLYYSYIAPAKTIYRRGRDGLTYAVGAYDTTKSWYSWSRGWYGYLFLGERGSTEDAAGRGDEVVDVRGK